MARLVPIATPLTLEVSIFVGGVQSKGSAAVRTDDPQAFRQAVRVEARRRGLRVRTGVADRDPNLVWAYDPDHTLSDEEYAREDRRAANLFAAAVSGVRHRTDEE